MKCLGNNLNAMNKKIPLLSTVLFIAHALISQTLVKDIITGTDGSNPRIMATLPTGFLFYANSTGMGKEPWFSDGTEQGTIMLKDIQPGIGNSDFPTYSVRVGNEIFFVAKHLGSFNMSLWKTDGTVNGTVQIKDLGTYNIGGGGNISAMPMVEFNGALYFSFDGGEGIELWKSDGTSNGTALLKDINENFGQGSKPIGFKVYNNNLYFFANNGINGNELWKTDGTANGTSLVKDLYQGSLDAFGQGTPTLFVFKNKLYFSAQGEHDLGVELYVTDGSSNGTVLFKDINTTNQGSSYPDFIDATDNYFIISANNATEGIEAWVSDGTANGTKLLVDISTGTASSYAGTCAVIGNKVIFSSYTAANGSELWVTDGTSANTKLLKEISAGTGSGYSGSPVKIGNMVYFLGTTTGSGLEIWETDGTEAGTQIQLEANPGSTGSLIYNIIEMGGKLYFNATITSEAKGNELYSYIPTAVTSINGIKTASVTLYPNPIKSGTELSLIPTENHVIQSVQIYNLQGQLVFETSEFENSITIPENIKSGIFILRVIGETLSYTSKLIIE